MKFKKRIKSWKKFPNVDTLGFYHCLGNYIQLNEFEDENEFKKSSSNPSLDKNRFSVYLHENQHYIDQISTYWGIKNIYRTFRAFNAALLGTEYDFHYYRDLILNLQRDYFLDYYTENYNHIVGGFNNLWKFQFKVGIRFDFDGKVNEERPIPLITFSSSDGQKISRVPLSVVSLLETTATYIEYKFLLDEVLKLNSPYKELQGQSLSKKLEDKLYHPELTLYSVAVHLTSVHLQINDPILGYKISSIFAKLALNLPESVFSSVIIPTELKEDKNWTKRSKSLIQNHDRGFIFYLLIRNYKSKYGELNGHEINVNNILDASNLPNEEEIESIISEEITKLDVQILSEKNCFNRQILDKVFFGNKFRKATGLGQQKNTPDLSEFIRDKPYLIFASTDFEYEHLELKPIVDKVIWQQSLSREEWFRLYTYCESRIDGFNEICGI
ncbi:hypothetical protein INQ45_01530 [Flavobacterium columnare]|uniref:hypothetical protein n=1 Tax=Flavobacterium columnare TaxID=996 RepID=UPI002D2018DC|nr:hypothetical protein [Flavobacterium columnare]MEB3799809.1 hypothetical protein [Flavobacterium columnare]